MKLYVLSFTYALLFLFSESDVFAEDAGRAVSWASYDQATARPEGSTPRTTDSSQTPSALTQQELDQILAPIALYPDALLSHILMASTYPLEVVEASRWSKANSALEGEDAVQAVTEMAWDPSVKSLVAFPQILSMMDEKLTWMEQLGDAFLTQQSQVMETVQRLRQRAGAVGTLESNAHLRVDWQGDTIIIEPANPQIIYVPYYDSRVMYGSWWWPTYQPVYWAPWPGYYYYGPRLRAGFTWGSGISVGPRFFFGRFNWRHRHVSVVHIHNSYYRPTQVNRVRVWTHNPIHRRGVRYRTPLLHQRFGHLRALPERRHQLREENRLSAGRPGRGGKFREGRGLLGNRPNLHSNMPPRFNAPGRNWSDLRGLQTRSTIPREFGRRFESRGGFRERSVLGGGTPRQFKTPGGGRSQLRGFEHRPSSPRELGSRVQSRGGFHERPGIGSGKGLSPRSFGGPRSGGGGRSHHRLR